MMQGQEFNGDALLQALQKGELTPQPAAGITLVGMVKQSDKPGFVSFTPGGCDTWVDVPTNLIEKAIHLGETHTHPLVRLTLKQPTDVEGQLLASLLVASRKSFEGALTKLPMMSKLSRGGLIRGRAGRGHLSQARIAAIMRAAKVGTATGAGSSVEAARFDCDSHCQAILRACLEGTPFEELCVFLYSTCFHLCTLFQNVWPFDDEEEY
jgi:hypothetical protein